MTDDTTYIYPISFLGADGQDIAIAFDEEELQSLVKILKKEGGPIAENLIQMFEIDQNDWAQFVFSFHGRFICDKCGEEHIGVRMAKQICEFLTKLLREKYPDCQSIINKLEEKPISDENVSLYGEMSERYIGKHRCTLKVDEYIIPNDSYQEEANKGNVLAIQYLEKLKKEEVSIDWAHRVLINSIRQQRMLKMMTIADNRHFSYQNEYDLVDFIASEMQKEGLDIANEENLDSYLNTKFM